MKRRIFLALGMLALGSCTSAGPFVTSISSDGNGNLIVEKAMVRMNALMGTVSTHEPSTTKIRLLGQSELEQTFGSSSR